MPKMNFWDLIEQTLEKAGVPLSAKEIWDKANEFKITDQFKTSGNTPWATIGAYCYTDINNNGKKSAIIQTSQRPAQFFLRRLAKNISVDELQERREKSQQHNDKQIKRQFHERDLHPLLVSYAFSDAHFRANLKTVFHEQSKKGSKGSNEWLHPDLVGVYFPFNEYKPEVIDLQSHLSVNPVRIFSFEMKVDLTFVNLREFYFQAVSNSSWANEGYLVVVNIEEDAALKDEIRRLNNAFGIGVIKLSLENVHQCEILFPARFNQEIDWDTVNRLASDNSGFGQFLSGLTEDIKLGKVKSQYDKVLIGEDMNKYIEEKKIWPEGL